MTLNWRHLKFTTMTQKITKLGVMISNAYTHKWSDKFRRRVSNDFKFETFEIHHNNSKNNYKLGVRISNSYIHKLSDLSLSYEFYFFFYEFYLIAIEEKILLVH